MVAVLSARSWARGERRQAAVSPNPSAGQVDAIACRGRRLREGEDLRPVDGQNLRISRASFPAGSVWNTAPAMALSPDRRDLPWHADLAGPAVSGCDRPAAAHGLIVP
jgi:hypothetical protein